MDTHRNPITSITAVLFPFVTYLQTLPHILSPSIISLTNILVIEPEYLTQRSVTGHEPDHFSPLHMLAGPSSVKSMLMLLSDPLNVPKLQSYIRYMSTLSASTLNVIRRFLI
jgi:hypothetical protein